MKLPPSGAPRRGVEVAFQVTRGGGSVAAASVVTDAEGRATALWTAGVAPVRNRLEAAVGGSLVAFCEVVTRDPFFVVGRAPRPDFRLADLLECRIGTVSEVPTPWMCLQDDLRRAGLDPDAVDRVADKTMADNAAALRDELEQARRRIDSDAAVSAHTQQAPATNPWIVRGLAGLFAGLALAIGWFAFHNLSTTTRPTRAPV